MSHSASSPLVAIVGGGPAGLMAAEAALARGARVLLFDHLASVGRKILIAGKGGLNLTHSEPLEPFVQRYGEASGRVADWLKLFGPQALRDWSRELGVETIIGSSGRVFPHDLKAAPLLRGWLRRLRAQGMELKMHNRWLGQIDAHRARFQTPDGVIEQQADAWILAFGGASWPVLGSDGAWTEPLSRRGIQVKPLEPANVGFELGWSDTFRQRYEGQPVKPVAMSVAAESGEESSEESSLARQGEFVVTDYGVEGSLLYALGASLRAHCDSGQGSVWLDLIPGTAHAELVRRLSANRGKRSLSEFLRRRVGLQGVRLGLLYELGPSPLPDRAEELAACIKRLRLPIRAPRPIAEAISSAGGVALDQLDQQLMLKALPGVFCAGEMLDWEAPTGGYLLTACFASGRLAGDAAAQWASRGQLPSAPSVQCDAEPVTAPNIAAGGLTCRHYAANECRSCSSLAVAYPEQLANKARAVAAELSLPASADWESPAASATTGFRNKAKLAVGGSSERPTLGILDADFQGLDLDHCLLYPPAIQRCLQPLRDFIREQGLEPYSVQQRSGELKYVLLTAAAGSDALMLRFVLRSSRLIERIRAALPSLQTRLTDLAVISVNLQPKPAAIVEGAEEILLSAQACLPMRFDQIEMQLMPGGFFQTNTGVASELYRTAQRWAAALPIRSALDLFCGVGGFALHLAQAGLSVRGWEVHPAAVEAARRAARASGSQAEFHCASVDELSLAGVKADLWLVNPPRRGLGSALIEQIRAESPPFLLYSSCNPQSLRADLDALPEYRPLKARLFDMFPHTQHAEVMLLLARPTQAL